MYQINSVGFSVDFAANHGDNELLREWIIDSVESNRNLQYYLPLKAFNQTLEWPRDQPIPCQEIQFLPEEFKSDDDVDVKIVVYSSAVTSERSIVPPMKMKSCGYITEIR
jgi:hypothetical protein